MKNPGLKRHNPDDTYITVTNRRTAGPLVAPKTDTTESSRAGYPLTDYEDNISRDGEGYTRRDDIEEPPPLVGSRTPGGSGGSNTPGPGVENGAEGSDPWIDAHQKSNSPHYHSHQQQALPRSEAGAPETLVPGEVRTHRPVSTDKPSVDNGAPPLVQYENDPNFHANQRRIEQQKQVGGGAKENSAYDEAQDRIREKMQRRRAHPLHQAAGPSDELHGGYDMMAFEHGMPADPENIDDPYMNALHGPGSSIHHVDPHSPQYDSDYERGWQMSQEPYDGTGQAPLEKMDDANASHAAYDGYEDYAVGYPRKKWHWRATRRRGLNHPDELSDEDWDNPEQVRGPSSHTASFQSTLTAQPALVSQANQPHQATHGPEEKKDMEEVLGDMKDLLDVQGAHGNWDYDPYMHGMFNGMELMKSLADGEEPDFRDAPESWGHEADGKSAQGRLSGEAGLSRSVSLATHSAEGSTSESDDEFWARQSDVLNTRTYQPTSPDATGQEFLDEGDPDWDEDPDLDDVIPENMTLRDHAKLLRSGVFKWNGSTRYPSYTHQVPRHVTMDDGTSGHAHEGHVIEHNTGNTGPALPSDDYEPGVLEYPWSHSYYPAGFPDHQGLTKGYNTLDQATHASHQLSLWGPHHPDSAELLKGYKRIGDEADYQPGMIEHDYARG